MRYLVPILAILLIFGGSLFKEVKDYLLKKEKIRADAQVRAEALRLKNQIELEKLIHEENTNRIYKNNSDIENNTYTNERKSDNRTRY